MNPRVDLEVSTQTFLMTCNTISAYEGSDKEDRLIIKAWCKWRGEDLEECGEEWVFWHAWPDLFLQGVSQSGPVLSRLSRWELQWITGSLRVLSCPFLFSASLSYIWRVCQDSEHLSRASVSVLVHPFTLICSRRPPQQLEHGSFIHSLTHSYVQALILPESSVGQQGLLLTLRKSRPVISRPEDGACGVPFPREDNNLEKKKSMLIEVLFRFRKWHCPWRLMVWAWSGGVGIISWVPQTTPLGKQEAAMKMTGFKGQMVPFLFHLCQQDQDLKSLETG